MVGLIITWVVFLIGFLILVREINKIEDNVVSLALAVAEDLQHVAKDFQQTHARITALEEKIKVLEEEKND